MKQAPTENSRLWRTRWEPLPDITAYEIAIDMKYVNASQIVAEWELENLGTALRHRVEAMTGQRMDQFSSTPPAGRATR